MPFRNRDIVSPVLAGRADELQLLGQALHAAQHGAGRCILLSGEAGIGKSRLLAELRSRASEAHFATVEGHCFEQDLSFPFAPWIDALRTFFARLEPAQASDALGGFGSEIVKLLPELRLILPGVQPSAPLDPDAEKRRLFEALARFLTRLSDPQPLLVIAEDIHWSDETSLDFLHLFARRLPGFPILLVASYRSEDVSAPLSRLLAQLDRERQALDVVLQPLSRDDVAAMVHAIFDIRGPIKADFLDLIVPLTEGNPFFVEETLRTLVEAGGIFLVDGRWERKPAPELHVPRSLQDTLRRRLELVSPAARQVLMLAAVAGRRFDFALLRELSGLDERELLAHLRELVDKHLVVERSTDEFAFRHALTREAAYAGVLKRERKELHRVVAGALERLYAGAPDAHLPDLAYHFYEAGAWDRALDYARQAGDRAQALYAPREALDHYTHALEAAQHLGIAPPFELLTARAAALETLGDFEPARGDLEAGLEMAQAAGDRRAECRAMLQLGFLWAARDYARSGEYLLRALDTARRLGDPALLGHTLNRAGNWHMNRDEAIEAQRSHEEALQIFEALDDRRGMAETLELLGVTSYTRANVLQGAAYCEQAIPLFREVGDRQGLMHSLAHLALAAQFDTEVGQPVDILQLADYGDTALELAREMGWRSGELVALINLAECLAPAGDYARALDVLSTAAAIGEEINHRLGIAIAHWLFGQVYRDILALSQAQQHLEQARAAAEASSSVLYMRVATADLASTYTSQNDLERAEAVLRGMLDDRPARTRHVRVCWTARAELALAQGDPAHALRIADELIASAPNVDRFGPRGIPRLSRLRGEALAGLGRTDEAEAALLAAREGAREQGRRPLLWRAHAGLGKLYRRLKRGDEAEQEFTAARELIRDLAAPLPDDSLRENFLRRALAMMPAAPPLSPRQTVKQESGGLTAREREVAVLVARGFTNGEIAGALVTSKRTAEKHVGSILGKLGFTSRAQIVAWAIQKGLSDGRRD